MAKSVSVNKKARGPGRPKKRGGVHPVAAVRLPPEISAGVVAWAAKQADAPGRSEAIRRLVELGLTVKAKARSTGRRPRAALVADLAADTIDSLPAARPGRRGRAQELARDAIEKMGDPTASPEERDQRRRRLTKGPIEFRAARVDQLKAKRK